jgi:hypothetical protein
MKIRFRALCVATILVGCTSSEPSKPAGTGAAGNGATSGTAGTGAAGSGTTSGTAGTGTTSGTAGTGTTAGTAGSGTTTGAAGNGATSGTAGTGTTSGTAGSGTAGGAAGGTGTAGSGAGTAGAAGAGGGAGAAGAAGSGAAGAGAGGSQVPADYTGKPLGGTPQSIPGMIQIESYDTGGSGVAYHASGNGHGSLCGVTRTDLIDLNCTGQAGSPTDQTQGTCAKLTGDVYLGYIGTGDWLNYTVNVKEAGTYAISTHVGVAGNTKLMFTFTPTVKTAALALTGTSGCGVESYHVWNVESIGTIALQPGTYVMRLDFVAAGLNIDWVAFTKM